MYEIENISDEQDKDIYSVVHNGGLYRVKWTGNWWTVRNEDGSILKDIEEVYEFVSRVLLFRNESEGLSE